MSGTMEKILKIKSFNEEKSRDKTRNTQHDRRYDKD